MKHRALAMPEYVAKLTSLSLSLIGLQPETNEDVIICPLIYEDGSVLSLITVCVAKRGWFKETPMLALSLAQLDEDTRAVTVYFKQLMTVPSDDSDLPCMLRYSAMVEAMLETHAKLGEMGKLLNLQRREAR